MEKRYKVLLAPYLLANHFWHNVRERRWNVASFAGGGKLMGRAGHDPPALFDLEERIITNTLEKREKMDVRGNQGFERPENQNECGE